MLSLQLLEAVSISLTLAFGAGACPEGSAAPGCLERENFLMEEAYELLTGEGVRTAFEPVAVIALRRTHALGGLLLERDVLFARGSVRVQLSEMHRINDGKCVWREHRSRFGGGRSWLARWNRAESEVTTLRWGAGAEVHATQRSEGSLLAPLEILERLRWGATIPVDAVTLDPHSERVIGVRVTSSKGDMRADPVLCNDDSGQVRSFELRSSEGRLIVRYVFDGASLLALQWQEGRWARRVTESEFEAHRRRWRTAAPGKNEDGQRLIGGAGRPDHPGE